MPQPRISTSFRLNPTYMVMSKRKLLQLVEDNHVSGWDDPRMLTIAGYRRRGFTASAIRNSAKAWVTKYKGVTDVSLLENAIREELNKPLSCGVGSAGGGG